MPRSITRDVNHHRVIRRVGGVLRDGVADDRLLQLWHVELHRRADTGRFNYSRALRVDKPPAHPDEKFGAEVSRTSSANTRSGWPLKQGELRGTRPAQAHLVHLAVRADFTNSPVPRHQLSSLATSKSIVFALIGSVVVPGTIERFKPMPHLAREAARLAEPGEPIGLLGRYGASSLMYYARRNITWLLDDEAAVAFLSSRPRAVCVMPVSDYARLAPCLPVIDASGGLRGGVQRAAVAADRAAAHAGPPVGARGR
jgi:hypothetical protein